jgi:hypothetical protein
MKESKKFKIAALLGVLVLTPLSVFGSIQQIQTPSDVLFGPAAEIAEIPVVRKLFKLKNSPVFERGKIEYLITRVRQSKHTFMRNGEIYGGFQAAMLLSYKYRKRIANIKTVDQFITDVASGSAVSGQPYYMRLTDGTAYKVRDVFLNELRVLDEYLSSHDQPELTESPSSINQAA